MQQDGPQYGLNTALSQDTAEPPVPLAKAWASTYPSENSPLVVKSNVKEVGKNATLPLLNLAQGVPGHLPHENLRRAMEEESKKDVMVSHGYGPVFGDPLLRDALANDLNQRYRGNVQNSEVAITSGANLAAGVVFHALAAPGDAVILPTPWYFNHEMTLKSLSVEVIPLQTESPTFQPDLKALLKLLNSHKGTASGGRIKAMVLVTPNNPTGSIYKKDLIWKFAQICLEWKIALILDETYREFLLDESNPASNDHQLHRFGTPHDLFDTDAHSSFDWRNTIISIHSFSKSFAIPGHRLGAIIAHSSLLVSEVADASTGTKKSQFGSLAKSLDNLQICPPRIDTQRAVAAGISDKEQIAWRLNIANDLLGRREKFADSLFHVVSEVEMASQLKIDKGTLSKLTQKMLPTSPSELGWKLLSSGAYYAYIRHPFHDTKSEIVAQALAALVGVVVLPGSFFRPRENAEVDRDLRISIANVERSLLDTLAARLIMFTALWKSNGAGWGI